MLPGGIYIVSFLQEKRQAMAARKAERERERAEKQHQKEIDKAVKEVPSSYQLLGVSHDYFPHQLCNYYMRAIWYLHYIKRSRLHDGLSQSPLPSSLCKKTLGSGGWESG